MPFNIELSQRINNVALKLQISRNNITLYFIGDKTKADEVYRCFEPVFSTYFPSNAAIMIDYVGNMEGDIHLKRQHLHSDEREVVHMHCILKENVKVDDLIYFLNFIKKAQNLKLSFPQTLQKNEAQRITKKFKRYLLKYEGTGYQKQFEDERILTEQEITTIKQNMKIYESAAIYPFFCAEDRQIANNPSSAFKVESKHISSLPHDDAKHPTIVLDNNTLPLSVIPSTVINTQQSQSTQENTATMSKSFS